MLPTRRSVTRPESTFWKNRPGRDRRGFYSAVPQTGALFGLALGSLAASITSSVFSDANFLTFGWRLPFLLSFILVLTELWIRNRVDETPSFKKVKSEHLAVKVPVVETQKLAWTAAATRSSTPTTPASARTAGSSQWSATTRAASRRRCAASRSRCCSTSVPSLCPDDVQEMHGYNMS